MKRWIRCLPLVAPAALAITAAPPARANDPATATMLFNEGRRLANEGKYTEACPKFEESERLDPGIGTRFNLADCYEHTARTASAWALFLDVASTAGGTGQEARELVARKRAAALEPHLSRLTIVAPKVAGLEVHRNGEDVPAMLWSSAVPVDPGSYTVEAAAPGRKRWSAVTTVGKAGASVTVTIPDLEEATATATAQAAEAPAPPPPDASKGRTERFVAMGLAGAGVVGLGIGTYFGIRSIDKHSDYEKLCTGNVCQPAAGPLHDEAVSAGTASTVSFVLGAALAAGGVALWFLAPRNSTSVAVAPAVGSSSAGATLAGTW
jgi:serine/threonine-protein kinase